MALAREYRDAGYPDGAGHRAFLVEDPMFNAIYLWSTHALAEIAGLVGADPAPHRAAARRLHHALTARLWDPARSRFAALDLVAGRRVAARRRAPLPLLDPDLPRPALDGILAELASPAFAPPPGGFGVPTFDLQAPGHDPRRCWRGPVWANTNWLLARGLRQHGEAARADQVDAATIALATRSGLREYFDPATGEGYGSQDFRMDRGARDRPPRRRNPGATSGAVASASRAGDPGRRVREHLRAGRDA